MSRGDIYIPSDVRQDFWHTVLWYWCVLLLPFHLRITPVLQAAEAASHPARAACSAIVYELVEQELPYYSQNRYRHLELSLQRKPEHTTLSE